MLKVGVIGCGKIAQVRHIPEYAANQDVEIVAFYDRTYSRAEDMAEKFGGKAYNSYQELLSLPEVDAVSVCVANHLHAEVTIAALKAGKHVLCEKPMATTMEDAKKMVATANEVGKRLLVGHNQLLTPAHQKAKELIDQGLIGKVLTFRTTFGHGGPETWSINPGPTTWFFDKEAAVMGAMGDLGVHKIYLLHYLSGQDVVEVTGKLFTQAKRNVAGELIALDDNAICIYKLTDGAVGTMTASWTYHGEEDNSTILYGSKGIMKIYADPNHSIVVKLHDGSRIAYDLEGIQTNVSQTKSGVIDEFVEAILTGKETILAGEDALKSMEVVFASIESSAKNKTVFLPNR